MSSTYTGATFAAYGSGSNRTAINGDMAAFSAVAAADSGAVVAARRFCCLALLCLTVSIALSAVASRKRAVTGYLWIDIYTPSGI